MTSRTLLAGAATLALLMAAASAGAETFVMKSGERIEGTVLRAGGNTVTIKRDGRGMIQTPIADIAYVEVETDSGTMVGAIALARPDGRYVLSTDQGQVTVRRGAVIDQDTAGASSVAGVPPAPEPVAPAPASPPVAPAPAPPVLAEPVPLPDAVAVPTALPAAPAEPVPPVAAAPAPSPSPSPSPDESTDLKTQFKTFLAELSQQGDLAAMGKDEIFQRYLEWQKARQGLGEP